MQSDIFFKIKQEISLRKIQRWCYTLISFPHLPSFRYYKCKRHNSVCCIFLDFLFVSFIRNATCTAFLESLKKNKWKCRRCCAKKLYSIHQPEWPMKLCLSSVACWKVDKALKMACHLPFIWWRQIFVPIIIFFISSFAGKLRACCRM